MSISNNNSINGSTISDYSSDKINKTKNSAVSSNTNKAAAQTNTTSVNLAAIYIDAANNGVKLEHNANKGLVPNKKDVLQQNMSKKDVKTSLDNTMTQSNKLEEVKQTKLSDTSVSQSKLDNAIHDVVNTKAQIKQIITTNTNVDSNTHEESLDIDGALEKFATLFADNKDLSGILSDSKLNKAFIKLIAKYDTDSGSDSLLDTATPEEQLSKIVGLLQKGSLSVSNLVQVMLLSIATKLSQENKSIEKDDDLAISELGDGDLESDDSTMPMLSLSSGDASNSREITKSAQGNAMSHSTTATYNNSSSRQSPGRINLIQQLIEFLNTEYKSLQTQTEIQLQLEKSSAVMTKENLEQSVRISQNTIATAKLNYDDLNTVANQQMVPNIMQASAEAANSGVQASMAKFSQNNVNNMLGHEDSNNSAVANRTAVDAKLQNQKFADVNNNPDEARNLTVVEKEKVFVEKGKAVENKGKAVAETQKELEATTAEKTIANAAQKEAQLKSKGVIKSTIIVGKEKEEQTEAAAQVRNGAIKEYTTKKQANEAAQVKCDKAEEEYNKAEEEYNKAEEELKAANQAAAIPLVPKPEHTEVPLTPDHDTYLKGVSTGVIKLNDEEKNTFLKACLNHTQEGANQRNVFIQAHSPKIPMADLPAKIANLTIQEKYANSANLKSVSNIMANQHKEYKMHDLDHVHSDGTVWSTKLALQRFNAVQGIITNTTGIQEQPKRDVYDATRTKYDKWQYTGKIAPDGMRGITSILNTMYEQDKNDTQSKYEMTKQINQATQDYVQEVTKNIEQDKSATDTFNTQNNSIKDIIKNIAQSLVEYSKGR